MKLDSLLGDLFAAPLEDFVKTRNDLAARLKSEGDEVSAKRVKALKKPAVHVWALNQVARRDPGSLERFISAREQVEGATNADELKRATKARRDAVVEVVREAQGALEEAGHSATSTQTQKISQMLLAGGTDEERSALLEGRLEKELTSAGLDDGWTTDVATLEPDVDRKREAARKRAEALDAEARTKEREADRLEAEAERAEASARVSRERAEAARHAAVVARDRASRALDEAG